MKKIYFVLSYTGTILSKIVRLYTKKNYSHISISLDENLDTMYSFGRICPYLMFPGGFVHEGINFGTFKRFKNTKAMIFYIKITDEQYQKLQDNISYFKKNHKKFKFNIMGLYLVPFNIHLKRKSAFYCAEFVKSMLDTANIDNNLPDVVKPLDFLNINDIEIIYEGKLSDYKRVPVYE